MSTPLCWMCQINPARVYDLTCQKMFCEGCMDARVDKEIARGLQRKELIAFENSFQCPFCSSVRSTFAFTEDTDGGNTFFAGWRKCLDCKKSYIQSDTDFLKIAKIEYHDFGVTSGSTEEQ